MASDIRQRVLDGPNRLGRNSGIQIPFVFVVCVFLCWLFCIDIFYKIVLLKMERWFACYLDYFTQCGDCGKMVGTGVIFRIVNSESLGCG
jgi:hypothetical protein